MSGVFSTGGVALIVLLSAILTIPTALVLISLYERSVRAAMLQRGAVAQPEQRQSGATAFVVPASALALRKVGRGAVEPVFPAAVDTLNRAVRSPWRAVAVYGVAGLGFGLLTALLFMTSGGSAILPIRLIVVTLTFAWPIVLTANLLLASSRWIQARNIAIYLALPVVLTGFNVRDIATLWLVTAGPPTLLLLAFMYPRVRTIGPLVFIFMTIGVFGANLLLLPLGNASVQRAAGSASVATGLDVTIWIILALIIGFAIASVVGWRTLAWVRGRYDAKLISDQSLSVDAIWLVFTVFNATDIASASPAWGFVTLGTFVVYRLLVVLGFRLLRDTFDVPTNHRLLLLRVFGSAARSTRLMRQIGARWRYVGSIQLITGTDLATSTVEPHDFLEFVRGRLGNRHIRDRDSLERHVAEMDLQPDFDGRFRINQFLCHEDMWRVTLAKLAGFSDAVLMDLRGFSPANQGCIFELQALVNLLPIARVVLVVDATTDVPFLRGVLEQAWAQMSGSSPNATVKTGQLVVCQLDGRYDSAGTRTLLARLAEASTTMAPTEPIAPPTTVARVVRR